MWNGERDGGGVSPSPVYTIRLFDRLTKDKKMFPSSFSSILTLMVTGLVRVSKMMSNVATGTRRSDSSTGRKQ